MSASGPSGPLVWVYTVCHNVAACMKHGKAGESDI